MLTVSNNLIADKANDGIESELTELRCDSFLKGFECQALVPSYSHFDLQILFNLPAKYVGCLATQMCVKNCCPS